MSGSGAAVLAAVLAGAAVALWTTPPLRSVTSVAVSGSTDAGPPAGERPAGPPALRLLGVAALAGVGVWVFLGGPLGVVLGSGAAVAAWRVLVRSEPAAVRRAREQAASELPHLVGLVAAGLRAGAPPAAALAAACAALPGAAADAFSQARARLELGVDPSAVWADLGADPVLGLLGRSLSRAHQTGASVLETVEALALRLAEEGRSDVEDRARAVGVRAAVPLGLCLLPAFLLLGIVPLVAGLVGQLGWS